MRLTLRTLLAYLDDQLDPAPARELGQKLAETPAAQELVSRIREVTRRRRLSAPPVAGDEIEPNQVAEYLNDLMGPGDIARVERICLDSDIHLAEVAACHQILSMIGQPAQVPIATRRRMYDLVHAIESIPADRRRLMKKTELPLSEAAVTGRPVMGRMATIDALVIGSVFIGWLAWKTVNWPGRNATDTNSTEVASTDAESEPDDIYRPRALEPGETPEAPTLDLTADAAAKNRPVDTAAPARQSDTPAPDEAATTKSAPPAKDASEKPAAPQPESPTNAAAKNDAATKTDANTNPETALKPAPVPLPIATYTSTSGVLMHFEPAHKDWRRLAARSPIGPAESLLCLPHQRAALQLETGATLDVVGETEFAIVPPQDEGVFAHLKLDRGRIVLGANQPNAVFRVEFLDQQWELRVQGAETEVGLWLNAVWRPGGPCAHEAVLYVPRGEVEFRSQDQAHQLGGPVQMRWSSAGGMREKESLAVPPAWKEEMTPLQIRAASTLDQSLPKDVAPALTLIEATGSDKKELRLVAIRSLGAIGRLPALIDSMNVSDRRDVRQEAIATLRQYIARGSAREEALSEALIAKFDKQRERADGVLGLLRGFTDVEAKQKDTYDTLIKLLSPERTSERSPELAIRELAIMNLEELAGKLENVNYLPDKPSDLAINAWRRQLDAGRLPPRERGKM